MNTSAHLTCYQIVTALYPQAFRSRYQNEMQLLFEDQLQEEGPTKTWNIIIRELPASLWREHYQNITGRKLDFMVTIKDISGISIGLVILAAFPFIQPHILEAMQPVLFSELLVGDSGTFSIYSYMVYILCGILVAYLTPKHAVRNAAILAPVAIITQFLVQICVDGLFYNNWVIFEYGVNVFSMTNFMFMNLAAIAIFAIPSAYLTQWIIKNLNHKV